MTQPPEDRAPGRPDESGSAGAPPEGPPLVSPSTPFPAPPDHPSFAQAPPPPYGQQPWSPPVYYQAPPPSGTNGFAIAALVFGIIGGCLLGFVFGIIALVKINRTGQKGRGLAIAGLVLSGLWVVVLVVLGIIGAVQDADRDSTGTITDSGNLSTSNLEVGDCVNNDFEEDTEVRDIPAVPCAEPHQGEVYAVVQFHGSTYPGNDALSEEGQRRCLQQLRKVAPEVIDDRTYGVFWFQPTDFTWARGDRDLACLAMTNDKRPGSILD